MSLETIYLVEIEETKNNKILKSYKCCDLKELRDLDGKENYNYNPIGSLPFQLKFDRSFKKLEELTELLRKERKEDKYFNELLDLILDTYNISYVNSEGKLTTNSLPIIVNRVYDNCLTPLNYEIREKYIEKADPYGNKETVGYGITTLIHREHAEKAFMMIAENGEIGYRDLDAEIKFQAIKLNEMRFVDYYNDKFTLRKFTPEEFLSWFPPIADRYSRIYTKKGRPSLILKKALTILDKILSP